MTNQSTPVDGVQEELIREAAEQLGMTAAYAWEVLVTAQPILGVITITQVVLGAGITGWVTYRYHQVAVERYYDSDGYGGTDEIDVWMGTALVGMVTLIVVGISVAALGAALEQILLPEYSALMEVLETLKETR